VVVYRRVESALRTDRLSRDACQQVSLIPWSRVLPEKLTVSQLVKKFPALYGTLRFITAFTSARHLSLS
jgi:hypothetical protein